MQVYQLFSQFFFHPSFPAGAVPWTMVPELFLQETRPVAVTVATIVNWAATFLVGFVFPYILVSSNASVSTVS